MSLEISLVPILSDNYAWLLHDRASGQLAVVDPAEEAPVLAAIERARQAGAGPLTTILLTHHHADHVAATDAVRAATGAVVIGAEADRHRLPRLDQAVRPEQTVRFGGSAAQVIDTPGHTRGHIAYYFADAPALFCGDTLFSLGCGRLFEGDAADMFASLARFKALPDDTLVCCGHEYTLSNARFARAVLPDNEALRARALDVERLRANGEPTLPVRLGSERTTNPFLLARDAEELGRLRRRKDEFRG